MGILGYIQINSRETPAKKAALSTGSRRVSRGDSPAYSQSRFQAISITVPASIGSGCCQAEV